jgi:hypothetical protein
VSAARRLISGPAGDVAAVAAVLLIASGLFMFNFNGRARQALPDTYWYTRQAVRYSGASIAHSGEVASRVECAAINRYSREIGMPAACHHYPTHQPNPRYARIFTTRPGFSLLAAPLVRLAGPLPGMEWATAIASVLAALVGYAAVRAVGGSRLAGIGSALLLYIFPSGYWTSRLLPEGAMLAGCLATGIGITMLWPRPGDGTGARPGRGRITAGIAVAVIGLAWTYVMKSANGFLLSAVLLAGGAALAAWTRARPRAGPWWRPGGWWRPASWWRPSAVITALVGLAGTVGWLVVSQAAHLPSFSDTIQDMASSHFRGRLTPSPIGYLVKRDIWFIPHWGLVVIRDVWPLPVAAAGIAALVWTCRARAVPWLLIGVTGPLAVAAHPIGSESDRLALPVWLPVIIGFVMAADGPGRSAVRRWAARSQTAGPAAGAPAAIAPHGGQPGTGRAVSLRSPARRTADNISSPPARS